MRTKHRTNGITVTAVILAAVIPLSVFFASSVDRKRNENEELFSTAAYETDAPPRLSEEKPAAKKITVDISSPVAILYDVTEKNIVFEKNADKKTAPASLAKLLTALTALEYCSPDTVFTVGDEIDLRGFNSSVCYLQKGWSLSLSALITGMLCASGSDAAYCIAVNVARLMRPGLSDSGAAEYFAGLMNDKAASFGMKDSRFTGPDGYDDANQYSTARDILQLCLFAVKNENVLSACDEYRENVRLADGGGVTWYTTNRLLDPADEYYYPGVSGLKTGTTDLAGCCLAAYYKGERELIAISLGNEDDARRYSSVTGMLNSYIK